MGARQATVLVTPRSFGRHDHGVVEAAHAAFAETMLRPGWTPAPGDAVELERVDGWIAGLERIDAATMDAAPRLRVIVRYGVGVENVDLDAAAQRGIVVTNTPGANAAAVAELTIALMFALARSLVPAARQVSEGRWLPVTGRGIAGCTMGLIGLGAIGREVAGRAQGLGMDVIATDPAVDASEMASLGITPATRDEVITRADVVSLHLPVTPQTRRLIDAQALARMRPGAFLINTARGELVDEHALADALQDGPLAGAALDTLSQEPPGPDHPLRACATCLITPHMGALTDQAMTAMGRRALADCVAVLDGHAPTHPVTHAMAVRT